MTKRETVNRNIGLTFDFLRQVVKDPSILEKVPNGSILEFVEKDFSVIEKKGKVRGKGKRKYMRVKSEIEIL